MQGIFEAIREACSPGTWSRGVELVRAGAVNGDRDDEQEVCVQVATRGGMHSPRVTLYLDDEEWECSCTSREDPCEHVAAAIIALRRARKAGRSLTADEATRSRIRYRLRPQADGRFDFTRELVRGERVETLTTTLHAIASGRVDGPAFAATEADIRVERVLGAQRRGVLSREGLRRVIDALAECDDVWLDEARIRCSAERVLPLAIVDDVPGGFRLRIVEDPTITRSFNDGIVLCGDLLRATGASGLTGREVADLPDGRFYSSDQAPELASEVLPAMQERLPVEIRTQRLPEPGSALPPRIRVRTERMGDQLTVLPQLVYGDPPCARIDAGRLVHLQGKLPIRNEAMETRLSAQLRRELGLRSGHRIHLSGRDALRFVERLEGWGGEVEGDAHQAFFAAPALLPQLEVSDENFDLRFESPDEPEGEAQSGGRREVAASAVLRAWRDGEESVALPGGGFAPLPADWLERFGDRVADLLAARSDEGRLPASVAPDFARLCDDLEQPRPASLQALAPLLESDGHFPEVPLPSDLRAELRPYQREGVNWLKFLGDAKLGALLADDMGLGKTIQALCALEGRCLVVAPTSVIYNWQDEATRFRPSLRCDLYHGPDRRLDPEANLTLTSYAILRLDQKELSQIEWDAVVLDEAQAIKNPDSRVTRAAFSLRSARRLALTGTPVENRLEELWSQLHFLNPGLLGGRSDFNERFARPIAAGEGDVAERLRARIRPFICRRLKRDVAPELPPRTEVVLHCVLSDDERRVYDAIAAATRDEVVKQVAAGGSVMMALEALLRLRQAACHSDLIPGQAAETSSKLELLLDRLEQAIEDGHKALVFSQWTSLLDRIEPHLAERGWKFARLDGSTRDRAGVVRSFQSDDGPPLMLASLKAGGTGLNLTAADHLFLLDPWWNPAVEDQAADRAHRIGQQRPVMVHRLVAERTVEERILVLQQRKRGLAEAALGDGDQAQGLSREELLELLS